MDTIQTAFDASRASQRLAPGERIEISAAGDVQLAHGPAQGPPPLLTVDAPTPALAIARLLAEAVKQLAETADQPTDWTPAWNLATIPDVKLNSELGRRRAAKRTYTRKLSVSE